jgi:RNA polymerase sigma-70 factor (ECF subfamily)
MITEALSAPPERIGFRSKPTLDTSEDTSARTRLAVARAKEGDREALAYLYITYSDNIYGYVRTIVHNDHEAEDVTQHVFAKLIMTIGRYEDRHVPFSAWLLRVARNVAIDHLRAKRPAPVEEVLDPRASTESDLDQSETLRAALAALPVEQRQVVVLRHLVGLTPREIAGRLGRTESSVNGLHHRARRALQQDLTRRDSAPVTHD